MFAKCKERKEQIEEFTRRLTLTNDAQHVQDRDRLLTEEEARQMIGVSYRTMRRWREARMIEYINLAGGDGSPGSDIRYTRESVQAFIAGHIKPVRPVRALRKLA